MSNEELSALISLLDDPDEEIYHSIEKKIISLGNPVIADLEKAWGNSFNHILQTRIEYLIHKIQFSSFSDQLIDWASEDNNDLLAGALLVAQYQYPDLDKQPILNEISTLKKDIWLELNDQLTALEKVHVINKIFFELKNYTGNTRNYHAPQNSFLNIVFESKKGSPLTLSIIYILLAQELELPIYGVNLPEHFVLVYSDYSKESKEDLMATDMLFYINPFSKGQVFGKPEIDKFLDEINQKQQDSFYLPCSNLEIIKRLLRNLIYSYNKLGDTEKELELSSLLSRI